MRKEPVYGCPHLTRSGVSRSLDLVSAPAIWSQRKPGALPKFNFSLAEQRRVQSSRLGKCNAVAEPEIPERIFRGLAGFPGHSHRNACRQIDGIHHCALAAMIQGMGAQNSVCARLQSVADVFLRSLGFRYQPHHDCPPRQRYAADTD